MSAEPPIKRAIAFFDGQNLFHAAKKSFACAFPNYDPARLAAAVCKNRGWHLRQTRFYTGVPSATDNPHWNLFWNRKLLAMSRSGVHTYSRPLRYRHRTNADGAPMLIGEEKGIDVRIAIDVLSCAFRGDCDVTLIFSQDQDLSEVADELRVIANEQGRWLKIASAFPASPVSHNRRGIEKTDWIRIERAMYADCTDPWDYRNESPRHSPAQL